MSDTPSRPAAPPAPTTAKADETASRAIESTGSYPARSVSTGDYHPAPGSGTDVAEYIGEYAVIRKIGQGGMGAVYLAEDTKLRRKAAIKTMKPELAANPDHRDRFLREARAAAAVEHDNIVPIWQIGETADGTPFIAMPLLQGEMLDARLKREPVSSVGIILKVAREVSDGLAAAHAKGLIHRDIKPGNVWLEGDLAAKSVVQQIHRCKILDFGLARSVDKEDAQVTASGMILGTPAYMAPEQARAEKVDHRADLFSLGAMLYRMATGQAPFRGANSAAVLMALAAENPPPPITLNPNLPPALSDLIDELMCKNPAGRPESAAVVGARVRNIIKEIQAKKSAPEVTPPPGRPPAAGSSDASVAASVVPVYVLPAPAPSPWEEVAETEEDAPIAKAPEPARRSRTPWFVAGGALAALAALALLAAVVLRVQTAEGDLVVEINDADVEARVKNGKLVLLGPDGKERYTLALVNDRNAKIGTGSYTIRVEGADGLVLDTKEFTIRKNGEVRVRVTLDPKAKKPDPPKDDPERRAAEYVLSLGGIVNVNDRSLGEITDKRKLPKEPFRLATISLRSKQVSDEGLAALKGCAHVTWLELDGTTVGDAGLAHLKDWTALTDVNLTGTKVTDAGVAALAGCKKLKQIHLQSTTVTDAGLVPFKGWKDLTFVNLDFTGVGDAGLAHLRDCKSVSRLQISGTKVSDAGVALFKDWKSLTHLGLLDTPVGDAGLAHLKDFPSLTAVNLTGTQVSDAGLVHLKKCGTLTLVQLQKTKVTAGGVADLAKALPQCRIEWAGGTVEPAALDADRRAAEYVLSVGGTVRVNGSDKDIRTRAGLPKEPFRLTACTAMRNIKVTDAGLAAFAGCTNLLDLGLSDTSVSDVGLAHFKDCKNLRILGLGSTQVTDAGLAHFKQCDQLVQIWLFHTRVGDAGLANFRGCRNLELLDLNATTAVTDAGLAAFKDCKKLTHLYLGGLREVKGPGLVAFKGCKDLVHLNLDETSVRDAELAPLKDCTALTFLDVRRTGTTAKGVTEFAKALPQCRIEWAGGTIQPKK